MSEETGKTGAPNRASEGRNLLDWLETASLVLAGCSLIAVVAVQAWQVFARYVLNDSPSWTEPMVLLLMSAAMMFGAAAGVRSESHFGFFITLHIAPPRVRVVL